jgi:hypothetical protein
MSRCVIDRGLTPTNGWSIIHPETGTTISGGTYTDWVTRMRQHYTANNLPIGTLWEWDIQDLLCSQKPSNFCRECVPSAPAPTPVESSTPARRGCCGGKSAR